MTPLEIVLLVLVILFVAGGFVLSHWLLLGIVVLVVLALVNRRGSGRL